MSQDQDRLNAIAFPLPIYRYPNIDPADPVNRVFADLIRNLNSHVNTTMRMRDTVHQKINRIDWGNKTKKLLEYQGLSEAEVEKEMDREFGLIVKGEWEDTARKTRALMEYLGTFAEKVDDVVAKF